MGIRVKVSSRHQIAVVAAARKELGIRGGDHLLVEIRDGYAVLVPEPRDYAGQLRGLHGDIWKDVEPEEYVRREREAWQE